MALQPPVARCQCCDAFDGMRSRPCTLLAVQQHILLPMPLCLGLQNAAVCTDNAVAAHQMLGAVIHRRAAQAVTCHAEGPYLSSAAGVMALW
jgi:hypothetical protein